MRKLILKTDVPRHWLFMLSGLLWSIAGSILLWRALGWLADVPINSEIISESLGTILGILFFFSLFKKIARKNRSRIASLPKRVAIYKFTSQRSAIIIAGMIAMGIILRSSAFPKHLLAVLYTAMGTTLWFGSFLFYKSWLNVLYRQGQSK